jgi:hypothetical protein
MSRSPVDLISILLLVIPPSPRAGALPESWRRRRRNFERISKLCRRLGAGQVMPGCEKRGDPGPGQVARDDRDKSDRGRLDP